MKKIFTLLAAAVLGISAFAQKINVTESTESIGGGSNNALVVTIYEADADAVEKGWRSLMKDLDAKVSSKDGGIFADNAMIKTMGNNPIDIYAKIVKVKDKEIKLVVGFDLGGAFLSSGKHSDQYKEAKRMMQEFAVKMTKEGIGGQLKAAEKVHEKLTDQHADLVKDQKNLEKDIEEYKAKIKKAEDEIVKKKSEQEKKKQEIDAQKKVVDAIKDKEKAVN
jgi:hypothetical protein